MRPDDWHLTENIDAFLARAGDFLRSRPALHTTPLTVAERLRMRGADTYGAEATVFGRLERRGEVHAIFYRLPSHRLSLTPPLLRAGRGSLAMAIGASRTRTS